VRIFRQTRRFLREYSANKRGGAAGFARRRVAWHLTQKSTQYGGKFVRLGAGGMIFYECRFLVKVLSREVILYKYHLVNNW
jgi:hypothetical protein